MHPPLLFEMFLVGLEINTKSIPLNVHVLRRFKFWNYRCANPASESRVYPQVFRGSLSHELPCRLKESLMLKKLRVLLDIELFNIHPFYCIVEAARESVHDSLFKTVSELSSLCSASNQNDGVRKLLSHLRIIYRADASADHFIKIHWVLHLLVL